MFRRTVLSVCLVLVMGMVNTAAPDTVLYFSFDNGDGEDFPETIQDEISGLTFNKVTEGSGTLTYDANTNPWFNSGGTSALFTRDSGLWRESITGPDILDLDGPGYTIEMFIKPASLTSNRGQAVLVRKYVGEYIFEVLDTGALRFSHAGETLPSGTNTIVSADGVVVVDQWYHVAAVFNSADTAKPTKIYLDGVEVASGGSTDLNPGEDDPIGIGHMTRPALTREDWFDGHIDELRISDEALDPSQFLLYGWDIGGPTRPNPGHQSRDVCPEGVVLTWKTWPDANSRDVYFGTDEASVKNAQVGDDPNNVYKGRQDSNTYPEAGSLSLELGKWYYWRVDEVNEPNSDIWPGPVWRFRTQDGNATDPIPGDGWKGLPPDVNLSWTPACTAASHTLYFGTSWDDVNSGGGGTNKGSQSPGFSPGALSTYTWHYWRVDEVDGPNTVKGKVWSFKTGLGGVLMYYKFDGSQGADLPSPITDDSGNNIQFTKHIAAAGTLKYAEPNPVYNPGGTSAEFIPSAGLYRLDTGEDDPLRLDGYQYTIEMWLYLYDRDYSSQDMWMVGKENDDFSWSFVISDLGDDDDLRWYHNDSDIDEGVLTERYDEWMHVAAVFDITDLQTSQRLYFNGEVVETGNNRGFNPADANAVGIGCRTADGVTLEEFLDGRIDELRILDVALDVGDMLYPRATDPSPYDGEGNVDPNDPNEPDDPNVTLSWTPWKYADEHDLYFGTDYDSVRLATTGDNPNDVYVGRLDSNSYDMNGLDYATNYYWRIDEVDGSDVYPGLVWHFLTAYVVVDPNLLLWYPYDEGTGDWVYDNSGHGLNASSGEVSDGWNPDGAFGYCLEFDDNIGFDLENRTLEGLSDGITIAVWLDGYRPGLENWVIHAGGSGYFVEVIVPDGNDDYVYWRAGNDTNDLLIWKDATPADWEGDWHHFAFVKDEDAGTMKIYFDADVARSKDGAISSLSNVVGKPFSVGAALGNAADYVGKMDDLRVYDHALSDKEIASLFRGGDIELAWGPSPYDGQPDAPYDSDLIWKPGDYAADTNGHDLYFGTDWDEVNDANILIHPNVDYNRLDVNAYELDLLTLGKYYYWRVDEVNDTCDASPWKGKVWRFRVADYIIIDDMEDYTLAKNSSIAKLSGATTWGWDDIYVNGTNAILGLVYPGWITYPEIGAHRSDQAMYYIYDSSADPWYSEISNHFTLDPNDWTVANVKMIALWFRGMAGNDADETMYMGLEDEAGASSYAQVNYGDQGEDTNDIKVAEWQLWRIALSDFTADNPSLELEKMQKLYIGFGDRDTPVPGGAGEVFFDNIRLYQPICVPSQRSAAFAKLDFDDDCIIGFGDVLVMGDEWLESDINLGEVTNPSDTNLVGWWNFDENDGDGNEVKDSSNNGHDGVIETNGVNVYWVAGRDDVNYALEFDGGRVLVPDSAELRPLHQVSAAAWVKFSENQSGARLVVKGPDNKECYALEIGEGDDLVFYVRDGNDPNLSGYPQYAADSDNGALDRNEWVHCAGTYDGNSVKTYINGELVAENNDANSNVIPFLSQDTNDLAIGNRSDATNRAFNGIIDDVRVYDRGLTAAEIGYLASDGTGLVAVESIANLIDGEAPGERAVNMRDFAVLADEWLKREFWP